MYESPFGSPCNLGTDLTRFTLVNMQITARPAHCNLQRRRDAFQTVAAVSVRGVHPTSRTGSFRAEPNEDALGERRQRLICRAGISREVDKLKGKLSDFGVRERLDVLNKFYRDNLTNEGLEAIMSENFKMGEEGYSRVFTKKGDVTSAYATLVVP